jgi:hypothetical protein
MIAHFHLSATHPGNIIWDIGAAQFWLPTATDKTIGVNELGGRPAFAALTIQGPGLVDYSRAAVR